jgi:ERCC4-type nuclease
MQIKVDIRENTLIKLLKALNNDYGFNFEIIVERMDLGDISIWNNGEELLLLERKSLNDLASSITDGRYAEQSYRLNGYSLHNHNIIYLVEGNVSHYSGKWSRVKPGTLYTTMFSIQYFKGFSLVRTFDITETAEYILRITDKLSRTADKLGFYHDLFQPKKKNYAQVVHSEKKKNITPENIGGIILSQIPGISKTTSGVIIEKYGSLFQLLKALEADKHCLDKLMYTTKKGQERRVSKTSIANVIQYLLYQKSNVIKIDT